MPSKSMKSALAAPLVFYYRSFSGLCNAWRRIHAFATLRAGLSYPLPANTVVMGRAFIYGTGRIRCGEGLLIYPNQYMETHGGGEIVLGDGVVLSTGVHMVAYAGIHIGAGSMIGEYTSIRDANHTRVNGQTLRDSNHIAKPVIIGREVWIGRGVAVLSGVTIGDGATVGANAVVTHNVTAGAVVAGVPARPIAVKAISPSKASVEQQTGEISDPAGLNGRIEQAHQAEQTEQAVPAMPEPEIATGIER